MGGNVGVGVGVGTLAGWCLWGVGGGALVGAGALSRCWRRHAGVGGGGTQQSTRGGRWKRGVGGDKHGLDWGGG